MLAMEAGTCFSKYCVPTAVLELLVPCFPLLTAFIMNSHENNRLIVHHELTLAHNCPSGIIIADSYLVGSRVCCPSFLWDAVSVTM